ncbi:GSU0071 family protein [Geobacter sp.]|uniref:GSU0071 family protein n=1 Tax=Geobacter sp. TaxID=46610 RepID=UPI001ACE5D3B|nr:hypothetical protein [Geobacter sp.]CAG0964440.1 hypothetical protein GEOBC_00912 [Geobacteraceae bacterium]
MKTRTIDEALDKYVQERMAKGKQPAAERFLSYAYVKYSGDEVPEFMRKVGGLTRYYIDFLKVMGNPLKGPELAWFASMLTVVAASCYLMEMEESRLTGILIFSGTLASAFLLICFAARKWCEAGVMIAIYREILEIAEQEAGGPA